MLRPGIQRVQPAGAPKAPSSALPPASRAIRLLTLAQFSDNSPWRLTLQHDQPDDVLLWITRGQGVVIVDGVRRGVGAHNALHLPAGTLFSVELGAQSLAQVIVARSGTVQGLPDEPCHLRIRDSFAQTELTAEFEAIQREQAQNRALVEQALAARMGLIAVWLNRQIIAGAADAPPETAARRLVHRFARLVVHEFRQGLTMADYADRLDVTPTHLARVCRECCGKTAADILTERRLHAARCDLVTRDDPVKAIAAGLGFQSAAYFTRFMQQHTGQSPLAYRKTHRPTKG